MTNIEIQTNKQMGAAIPNANLLQWMGIINAADYFIGCDSMGQHYAHALNKPATVVIGSTFPENISYPSNKNFTIIDNGKDRRVYSPIRVTMDFVADRVNEDLMILEDKTFDRIIKSVTDKLGKTKQAPEQPNKPIVSDAAGIIPPFSKKLSVA
jgi:ADP-heptose:LPS heptosyltransferase